MRSTVKFPDLQSFEEGRHLLEKYEVLVSAAGLFVSVEDLPGEIKVQVEEMGAHVAQPYQFAMDSV
jgi:hypothetical protein